MVYDSWLYDVNIIEASRILAAAGLYTTTSKCLDRIIFKV